MPRTEQASARIPDASLWPELSGPERAYRQSVLDDMRRRVSEEGPRTAWDHADRARQFMPFDALEGYSDMVEDAMREDPSET